MKIKTIEAIAVRLPMKKPVQMAGETVANEPASNQAGCASQRPSRRASQRYNPRRSLRRNAVRGMDGSFSEPSVAIRGRGLDNRLDRAANVIGAE